MISSGSNAQIKQIMQLLKKHSSREKEKLFVAEGLRIGEEIPEEQCVKVYLSETAAASDKTETIREKYVCELVKDSVFQSISDTISPQGVLAVCKFRETEEKDILEKENGLFLLLDHIQDPGNLGTIVRMGEAAGVSGIIMSKDTVDIYNPKVVRSTMGAIFRVPFCYSESLKETIEKMKKSGIQVYGAALLESRDYAELDYTEKTAFVIGNEANGISKEVLSCTSSNIHIPMKGQVESLNAAVAASVLMFEAARQRRK